MRRLPVYLVWLCFSLFALGDGAHELGRENSGSERPTSEAASEIDKLLFQAEQACTPERPKAATSNKRIREPLAPRNVDEKPGAVVSGSAIFGRCVKCHQTQSGPDLASMDDAAKMVDSVRSGRMPKGSSLSEAEKAAVIAHIEANF